MEFGSQTVNELLASLAAKKPTPGGGAVAGVLSALSTSLGEMVLAYTEGKDKYSQHEILHSNCSSFFQSASEEAIVLAEEDANAYEALNGLWKLDKDNPTREKAWSETLQYAIEVPLKTMELSHRILITLQTLVGKTNAMLRSDLVIAAILAESAARSARLNVEINVKQMDEGEERTSLQERTATLLGECQDLCKAIEDAC
ncbi:MAG: cyclodeaminase/cyclohydrolase family protein [Phycisphaerales bacterium]|nr:cyclodeaminase/cyclohydrolase family protein [Planctomycetota bacterium]MBL6996850.1 cyclodeaminase/cyclohydrolase family protein [Phycisphaerales bacterium]